jgi:mannuronan synthase
LSAVLQEFRIVNVVNISPSVAHEHIAVRLPLQAVIESTAYEVPEWSASGFRIAGFDDRTAVGTVIPLKLVFPFDAFSLMLSVKVKILRTNLPGRSADVVFLGLTRRQSELLQYVSDAYLTEELVATGDLIEVVARTPSGAEMPKVAESTTTSRKAWRLTGRILGSLGFAAAAIGLIAYLASSTYQRIFVIPAISGLVTVDVSEIASPAAGIAVITAKGTSLKVGDPVAELTTLDGEVVKISSPCNCTISVGSQSGPVPVAAGARIAALSHDDSAPQISAFVRYEDLLPLHRGASVKVFYADGSASRQAAIGNLPPLSPENFRADSLVEVKINPGAELKRDLIGQPVYVLFDTGPF